jgi:hypothetical protein
MGRRINAARRDGCTLQRAHRYPTLVVLLIDALHRLRGAQIDQRRQAAAKATSLTEAARLARDDPDHDDESRALANKKAAEAVADNEALQCFTYWRGVSALEAVEFKARGCSELGFTSLSKDKDRAVDAALSALEREEAAALAANAPRPKPRRMSRRPSAAPRRASRSTLTTAQAAEAAQAARESTSEAAQMLEGLREAQADTEVGRIVDERESRASAESNSGSVDDAPLAGVFRPVQSDEEDENEGIYLILAPKREPPADGEPVEALPRLAISQEEAADATPDQPAGDAPAADAAPSAAPSAAEPEEAEPLRKPKRHSTSFAPMRLSPGIGSVGLSTSPTRDTANAEPPLLLFRVAVQTETTLPVDIGFLSVYPEEKECVYPPGVYLEQRKESLETLARDADAEMVSAKVAEVAPSNVGRVTVKTKPTTGAAAATTK